MKRIVQILVLSSLVSVSSMADVSIPRDPTRIPPVNSGRVTIPRPPGSVAGPQVGIGEFESLQFLVMRVLTKTEVKKERQAKYAQYLLKYAQADRELKVWLKELDVYFDSQEYKSLSPADQQKEKFEARILIEMTIKHYMNK